MAFKAVCECGPAVLSAAGKPESGEDCPSCGGRMIEQELPRPRTAQTVERCLLTEAERMTANRLLRLALGD